MRGLLSAALLLAFASSGPIVAAEQLLRTALGFDIAVYADGIANARMLRFSRSGALLVSAPRKGKVWLLENDRDGDGRSDGRRVLLDHLNLPHGLAFYQDWLYVAETDGIFRIGFDHEQGRVQGSPEYIAELPEGNHWRRTIHFGPDGWLYVNVGSPCNVCIPDDPRRATILRMRPDGTEFAVYARGLRNSVDFDWAPWSGELYATENGRDWLGDDYPPCELNRIVEGGFYGWPHINGFGDPDPEFGDGPPELLQRAIPPVHGFRAHNSPVGIHFLRNPDLPDSYRRSAIVALHGSWNRSIPDGYRLVLLRWHEGGRIEQQDFVTGFEVGGQVVGRPVDVLEGPDKAIYVSDDHGGRVYRIRHHGRPQGSTLELTGQTRPATTRGLDRLAELSAEQRRVGASEGAVLFQLFACESCHRRDQETGRKLMTLERRYTLESLTALFAAPPATMPVFPLSTAERRSLAIYLLENR